MTWQAAAILVAGFVVAGLLSYRQHLGYQRVVNRVATEENASGKLVVTGRAKGKLRGAVVLLVLDRADRRVTRALVMEGATVFAGFRERPDLLGPLADIESRANTTPLTRAVTDARHTANRLTAGPRAHPR
jgi:glucitol operon activator protein